MQTLLIDGERSSYYIRVHQDFLGALEQHGYNFEPVEGIPHLQLVNYLDLSLFNIEEILLSQNLPILSLYYKDICNNGDTEQFVTRVNESRFLITCYPYLRDWQDAPSKITMLVGRKTTTVDALDYRKIIREYVTMCSICDNVEALSLILEDHEILTSVILDDAFEAYNTNIVRAICSSREDHSLEGSLSISYTSPDEKMDIMMNFPDLDLLLLASTNYEWFIFLVDENILKVNEIVPSIEIVGMIGLIIKNRYITDEEVLELNTNKDIVEYLKRPICRKCKKNAVPEIGLCKSHAEIFP